MLASTEHLEGCMGSIDEVSMRLGELLAKMEQADQRRQEMAAMLSRLHGEFLKYRAEFKAHVAVETVMHERLIAAEMQLKGLERIKQKILLAVAAVGGGSGAMASGISAYAKVLLGGHG